MIGRRRPSGLAACCLALAAGACAAGALADPPPSVAGVRERFDRIRPAERDLVVYQLDWARTLPEALERARREERPVLLLVVTNSYGDLFTGHC